MKMIIYKLEMKLCMTFFFNLHKNIKFKKINNKTYLK